jgi:hypothetical protein
MTDSPLVGAVYWPGGSYAGFPKRIAAVTKDFGDGTYEIVCEGGLWTFATRCPALDALDLAEQGLPDCQDKPCYCHPDDLDDFTKWANQGA